MTNEWNMEQYNHRFQSTPPVLSRGPRAARQPPKWEAAQFEVKHDVVSAGQSLGQAWAKQGRPPAAACIRRRRVLQSALEAWNRLPQIVLIGAKIVRSDARHAPFSRESPYV